MTFDGARCQLILMENYSSGGVSDERHSTVWSVYEQLDRVMMSLADKNTGVQSPWISCIGLAKGKGKSLDRQNRSSLKKDSFCQSVMPC